MAKRKIRRRSRSVRAGSLVASSLCLAVGLLLVCAGAAVGLSGLDTNEPAVHAQYPDMTNTTVSGGPGAQPAISSLGDVVLTVRKLERNPQARRQFMVTRRTIVRRAMAALSTPKGLAPGQSGSIVLLVGGVAVMCVGGILRWRRGVAQV